MPLLQSKLLAVEISVIDIVKRSKGSLVLYCCSRQYVDPYVVFIPLCKGTEEIENKGCRIFLENELHKILDHKLVLLFTFIQSIEPWIAHLSAHYALTLKV